MEKFLIEIVLVLGVLAAGLVIAALTARRCPTCSSTRVYYRHARKGGGPDRRFKNNPLICANCTGAPKPGQLAGALPAQALRQQQAAPVVADPADTYKAGDWVVYDGAMVARLGTAAKICVQVEIDAQGVLQPFARLHRHPFRYRHATQDEIQRAIEGDNVTYYNQDGTRDTFYQPIRKAAG